MTTALVFANPEARSPNLPVPMACNFPPCCAIMPLGTDPGLPFAQQI